VLVAHWPQDGDPGEVSVGLVLLVNDLQFVLAGGHETVLIWHQVLLLVVQISGEFGRIEDVEGDNIRKGSPLLINRTVPGQVNPLEARELVLLVLENAQGDFLSRNLSDLPLRNNFLDTNLETCTAKVKSVDVRLEVLKLQVLSD